MKKSKVSNKNSVDLTLSEISKIYSKMDSKYFNMMIKELEEKYLKNLIIEAGANNNYVRLQVIEDVLKNALVNLKSIKNRVALQLLKNDLDLNKEVVKELSNMGNNDNNLPKSNPRFSDN